jgi:cyclopropane-fatty-acyl-phospholipid synthase
VQLPDGTVQALRPRHTASPSAAITLRNWNVCGGAQVGRHRLCRKLHRGRLDHTHLTDLLKLFIATARRSKT